MKEEMEILPAAWAQLTPADWRRVAAAVPAGSDPLFGGGADERYHELRQKIAIFST